MLSYWLLQNVAEIRKHVEIISMSDGKNSLSFVGPKSEKQSNQDQKKSM